MAAVVRREGEALERRLPNLVGVFALEVAASLVNVSGNKDEGFGVEVNEAIDEGRFHLRQLINEEDGRAAVGLLVGNAVLADGSVECGVGNPELLLLGLAEFVGRGHVENLVEAAIRENLVRLARASCTQQGGVLVVGGEQREVLLDVDRDIPLGVANGIFHLGLLGTETGRERAGRSPLEVESVKVYGADVLQGEFQHLLHHHDPGVGGNEAEQVVLGVDGVKGDIHIRKAKLLIIVGVFVYRRKMSSKLLGCPQCVRTAVELVQFGAALPSKDAEGFVFCCRCFERLCGRCSKTCLDALDRGRREAEVEPCPPNTGEYCELCSSCLVELPFRGRKNQGVSCIHSQHLCEFGGLVDPGLVDSNVVVQERLGRGEREAPPLVNDSKEALVE